MSAGQLPEGRYGSRTAGYRSRRAWVLGMLLAVLAGLVVAIVGYRNIFQTPVRGEALGFTVPDGSNGDGNNDRNAVTLRFAVIRQDPQRPAVCIVRARSRDGEETGRKEVYVPPTAGPAELTAVIKTSRPPVTAEVYGCSLQVPAYLRPQSP